LKLDATAFPLEHHVRPDAVIDGRPGAVAAGILDAAFGHDPVALSIWSGYTGLRTGTARFRCSATPQIRRSGVKRGFAAAERQAG
jgi:hypothetical protein